MVLDLILAAPHTARLTLLNGLPFGMLKFNATIDLSVAGGPELAAAIEERWRDRTLLTGSLTHRFDAVRARGGYAAEVDYRGCATALRSEVGVQRLAWRDAWDRTAEVVGHSGHWLLYQGGDEQPGERDTAEAVLTHALVDGCWEAADPLERYDNGFSLPAVRLRDPATLHGSELRRFIRTEPQAGEILLMSRVEADGKRSPRGEPQLA